eukprot:m51a1_g6734 hypothetical protein (582) ;mRNA; f:209062-212062
MTRISSVVEVCTNPANPVKSPGPAETSPKLSSKDDTSTKRKKEPLTARIKALCVLVMILPLLVLFIEISLVPALPDIQKQFGSQGTWTPWILSAYNIVGAVWVSVSSSLADLYGAKGVTSISIALCIVGQIILVCGGSVSIFVAIAARLVQGFGMACTCMCMSIVNKKIPLRIRPMMMALTSSMISVGMSAGLVGGAALIEHMKWYHLGFISFPICAVVFVAFLLCLPTNSTFSLRSICSRESAEPEPEGVELEDPALPTAGRPKARLRDLDFLGIAALAAGVVALLVGLTLSEDRGWSDAVTIALTVVGVAVLVLFVAWEFWCHHPLIPVRFLLGRTQLVLCSISFTSGIVTFSLFQTLPYLYTSPAMSYRITRMLEVGALMLPFGVLALVAAFIAQFMRNIVGSTFTILVANVTTLLGVGLYIWFKETKLQSVLLNCTAGMGFGMSMVAINEVISVTTPPSQFGAVAGANLLLRFVGGSLGPVFVTLIMRRTCEKTPEGIVEYRKQGAVQESQVQSTSASDSVADLLERLRNRSGARPEQALGKTCVLNEDDEKVLSDLLGMTDRSGPISGRAHRKQEQ